MPIISQCKSLSATLAANLKDARTVEDRHACAAQALEYAAVNIFPLLDGLRGEKGAEDEQYRQAQQAILEMLTFVCIPFVRTITMPSLALAFLEEQSAKCEDSLIRKKFQSYINQIQASRPKRSRGGVDQVPGTRMAALKQTGKGLGSVVKGSISTVCLGILLILAMRVYMGSMQLKAMQSLDFEDGGPATNAAAPPQNPAASPGNVKPGMTSGEFRHYAENNGLIINSRPQNEAARPVTNVTNVIRRGNHVLVPVTLRHHGKETQAMLLLDTGASQTTISEDVAQRLDLDENSAAISYIQVADGRAVPSFTMALDSVSVGSQTVSSSQVTILQGAGGMGSEGLLGMSFLKNFRYRIDYNRGIIEWGG